MPSAAVGQNLPIRAQKNISGSPLPVYRSRSTPGSNEPTIRARALSNICRQARDRQDCWRGVLPDRRDRGCGPAWKQSADRRAKILTNKLFSTSTPSPDHTHIDTNKCQSHRPTSSGKLFWKPRYEAIWRQVVPPAPCILLSLFKQLEQNSRWRSTRTSSILL